MKRIFSLMAVMVIALVMTGCSSMGHHSNPHVGKHASELSDQDKESLLKGGFPVQYGTSDTGYTIQCHIVPGQYNQVAIYNGHNAPGLSRATHQAMMVQMADNNCNVLYRPVRDNSGKVVTVSPVTILNDAVAQEDMWRVMARTITPAVFNGTGAALINSNNRCKNGACGPVFNVISQANADSDSGVDTDIDINTPVTPCTGNQCPTTGPPDGGGG